MTEAPQDSVEATYDTIAKHFAATREYAWPEVESFCASQQQSSTDSKEIGLDLGCGNGRHGETLSEEMSLDSIVGIDLSQGLLQTARTRATNRGFIDNLELIHGDAGSIPLQSNTVSIAVYVATLHHLQPRDQRVASLSEVARVLESNGQALISAWSTEHDRFDRDRGFDTTVEWTLRDGTSVPRYYHIYDPDEFRSDLNTSALSVIETEISSGNCYAVVEDNQ
jgi:Methylase involved in ubiquinone/menaquinone biosynthesis